MNTTNSIKFATTKSTVETYRVEMTKRGEAQAVRTCADKARRLHSDAAFQLLADGIYAASQNGHDRGAIMLDTWTKIEEHAADVAFGYKAGLALAGPRAQRHAGALNISPIALAVGEARTFTPIHDLKQLQEVLRSEPDLVEMLKRTARAGLAKDDLMAAWGNAPEYLRKEIMARATNARFAEPDQKAKVLRNGEYMAVKARAFAGLEALDKGGRGYRVVSGAERAIQQALKLAFYWADRADWWENVILPREPHADQWNDEVYAGEEEWSYSSPIETYRAATTTLGAQWESKRDAFLAIPQDYAEAAVEAEALINALEDALLSQDYEITYCWEVINAEAGLFEPITDRQEAETYLLNKQEASAAKRAARDLGFEVQDQHGLVDAVLAGFSDEEAAALRKLQQEVIA